MDILFWLLVFAIILFYLWHSGTYTGRARELATRHCQQLGLQLLDQSMVIRGIWPFRDANGKLNLRRRYQFEFSSIGDRRYQGMLVLAGLRLQSIELEAYKIESAD